MKAIQFIVYLLILSTSFAQAQKNNNNDQQRTIEINNSKGELIISFENSVITEFTVNDEPIAKERYKEYQEIINDFSDEEISDSSHLNSIEDTSDENAELRESMVDYLLNAGVIMSSTKYNIQLRKEYLKVNKKNISSELHEECLNFFEEIYGHTLNSRSTVVFKKSKNNSSSSINIQM